MNRQGTLTFLSALVFISGFLLIPAINYLRLSSGDLNYPPLLNTVRYPALIIFSMLFIGYYSYIKISQHVLFKFNTISIGSIFCLGIFLSSIYPFLSIDLYEYIARGRILSIYHANPYLHPPSEFPGDVYYKVIFWKYQPMIYGPVWAYCVSLVTFFTGNSIFFTQFLIKFILFIAHLLTAFFLYRLAKELKAGEPYFAALAYLLNPFVLMMSAVEGHLDPVMMLFLIASLYFLFRNSFYPAFLLLSLSVLTKYLPIILCPFYFVYMYSCFSSKREFLKKSAASIIISAFVCVVFYLPLWGGLNTFSAFKVVGTGFDTNSFPYIIYRLLSLFIRDLPKDLFRYALYSVFAIFYLAVFFWFLSQEDKKRRLVDSILCIFSAYILFASFQLGAWYFLWLIPFLLISRIPFKYELSVLLSFAALISFWKRITFLIIAAVLAYLCLVFRRKGRADV